MKASGNRSLRFLVFGNFFNKNSRYSCKFSKRQLSGHLFKLKKSVIVFFRTTGEYYEQQRLSFSKYQ